MLLTELQKSAKMEMPPAVLRLSQPSAPVLLLDKDHQAVEAEFHSHLRVGGWLTFLSHRGELFRKEEISRPKGPSKDAGFETRPLTVGTAVFSHHQKTLGDIAVLHPETSSAFMRAANLAFKRHISTINHNNTTPRMETESKMSWVCLWLSSALLSFRLCLIKNF